MDAPVCRICGEKHWSRVCGAPPVTKTVTFKPDVTRAVTRCTECEALRAEVKMLKAELAKARPAPLTPADRMRKMRAKTKERP